MTTDEFRALALSFPEATESSHMDHPDFRVGGKIFATLAPRPGTAMVKLSPELQGAFLAIAPSVFTPASGAWGRGGATMVDLAAAGDSLLRDALAAAWKLRAPKKLQSR